MTPGTSGTPMDHGAHGAHATGVKIAYLLKKFPRLSETFVLNEILMQELLGADIHVFSRRAPDDEPRHPELSRLRATVEVMAFQNSLEPWLDLFGAGPENHRLLARFGEIVREMSAFEHPRMPALFAEALYLLRRTRELSIEHVHVHFATDSALVAMLLRELGGPSYSVTAHAKDIYRSTVDPRLLSRILERSAFTVTVCDANLRYLREMLSPEASKRVRRLYNGIDLAAFRPRGVWREENHVLCVGRLVEKKGFTVLVDALASLAQRGLRVQATLIGEGEDRPRIEGRIAERGLSASIRMLGALDQEAVREWMSRATLMCLPCIVGQDGNRDALPTTLLEAQAMGLPCISTPVTGIPEILAGGQAGVLVPENDVEATADAIEKLLVDAGERTRLAEAGRRHVLRLFDGEKSARTLSGWLEAAIEEVATA